MVRKLIIMTFLLILTVAAVSALKNPSAVYCEAMGYDYHIVPTDGGGYHGECELPDGSRVDSWRFLEGKEGSGYSYCIQQGYELKTVDDRCDAVYSAECSVCVVDGEEIEVTTLMNLSFAEGICGDGFCVVGEDHSNCPADCDVGCVADYCEENLSRVSDKGPDDEISSQDRSAGIFYISLIFAVIAFLVLMFVRYRKNNRGRRRKKIF